MAAGRALESSERPHNNPKLRLPPTPQSAGLNTASPSVLISEGKVDWKLEAAKNAAKYTRLQAELRTAIDTLAKRKEERDKWKQFAERLQKKIEALEARLGQQGPQELDSPASTTPRPRLVNAQLPAVKQNFRNSAEPMLPPLPPTVDKGIPPATFPHVGGNDHSHDDSPTGSGTTDGTKEFPNPKLPDLPRENGPGTHIKIKEEPPSDTPVVVSERAVKKRKRDEPEVDQPRTTRVKEEAISQSEPMVTADVCDFSPATSVDLDESGTRFDTPRKNTELDRFYTGHTPCPGPQVRPDSSIETHGTPRVPDQVSRAALQPLNPNVQTPRLQRPPRKGLAHAVGVLAEDGASYELSARDRTPLQRTEPNTGRLTSLLSGASKASESPIIRAFRKPETPRSNLEPRPIAESRASATSVWLQTPQPRELPFDKINRDRSKATPKQTPSGTSGGPTPSTASKKESGGVLSSEPKLRTRPVSVLKVDDFKINPNFNGGFDYAFSEVVRNKDDRACLPGCTDMECCGKSFRAMALAERGNGRRTAEQLAEDKKLLEDYLGEEAHRLFSMTKEERDELWLEAKTKELANRIGKHRHRFSRMKTPPGFWRTDFPDTQELHEDRVQALRREKEMIQERHREAMRPGGKWVFRDE